MYFIHQTIPKLTLVSNPYIVTVVVAPGIIRKVRIAFPTGCFDLVGIWFNYRSSRLYPVNDDGYFVGNGSVIEFNPDTLINEPPLEIQVLFFNNDDTYDHAPAIAIEMDFIGGFNDRERVLRETMIAALPEMKQ